MSLRVQSARQRLCAGPVRRDPIFFGKPVVLVTSFIRGGEDGRGW